MEYSFFNFRYKEALMSLVKNVLEKLQFKYNQSQLEELDDETLDYDVSLLSSTIEIKCLLP